MKLIYSFIIGLYRLAIEIASFFSPKAKLWINGRKNWQQNIQSKLNGLKSKPIWFHVSSVGEFEQGKPILEEFRKKYPRIPIVLTFFSPSGFELLKETEDADFVFYLPLDSVKNARTFLNLVKPRAAIFIKYEFWLYYFEELHKLKIPFTLISAKLRKDQFFFKWYGKSFSKILLLPNYFFVQDEETKLLLNNVGQQNVLVTGDTRVDRVNSVLESQKDLEIIEQFKNDQPILVVGSAWKKELEFIGTAINKNLLDNWKVIIAPHEINEHKIEDLKSTLKTNSVRYYQKPLPEDLKNSQVLIIDGVGILKYIYKYCDLALIGGGFIDGIHNILEPAAFGVPSIFGPNHYKFPEAKELIRRNGGFEIKTETAFLTQLQNLISNKDKLEAASINCSNFIAENKGATNEIMNKLKDVIYVE